MHSEKGTFIISIDFEYATGYADSVLSESQKDLILKEAEVSKQVLNLFDKYNIPATWAIVGHLLETDCQVKEGRVHADFPEQIFKNNELDWFSHHPSAGNTNDPMWFDSFGVIKLVQESPVDHEIASHSYSHILYGDPSIKSEAIEADLAGVEKIHRQNNLTLTSFIFPRNMEGYHEDIKNIGVRCYRGESKFWYHFVPGPFGRLARLFDYVIPVTRTVTPSRHESGLINIPDSLLLLGRNGLRKLITRAIMKRKIRAGVKRAVERKEIFHLWFHPSNFSYDTETQLEILEDTLIHVNELRDKGVLNVSTMKLVSDNM